MKLKIFEYKNGYGESKFIVKRRFFLFFWHSLHGDNSGRIHKSYKLAVLRLEHIERNISRNTWRLKKWK